MDPKAAAFAGLGFDADLAAHALDGFADDSEADAGAFVFLIWIEALEHHEYAFLGLSANADARVLEPKRMKPSRRSSA